ncbi:MAG TPA: methylmalonyl Co-A mutase-associated GTPase MeaB, partial [Burkholderiales bacterium]|nr:methylmalonyl Co-A mutase-associated GTPase MeaB [Burkholderiales bacterium]
VGVGQSEIAVAGMTDVFVLLQLPNAGDELQAIKKGIVELADLVVFNKIDLDRKAAESALNQMKSALTMLRSADGEGWRPPVLGVSAITHQGIAELWREIERYREIQVKSGKFAEKRRRQALAWMWELIDSGLKSRFHGHPPLQRELKRLAQAVDRGTMTPAGAASRLLQLFET